MPILTAAPPATYPLIMLLSRGAVKGKRLPAREVPALAKKTGPEAGPYYVLSAPPYLNNAFTRPGEAGKTGWTPPWSRTENASPITRPRPLTTPREPVKLCPAQGRGGGTGRRSGLKIRWRLYIGF